MEDLIKLTRYQILTIIVFIVFKLLRPFLLENSSSEFLKIILLSLPNLFEGIVGMITLTMLGLYVNHKWLPDTWTRKDIFVYLMAIVVGEVYVVSQEFGFHHLGGNNVFDPMDVVFSQFGLFAGFALMYCLKPTMYTDTRSS